MKVLALARTALATTPYNNASVEIMQSVSHAKEREGQLRTNVGQLRTNVVTNWHLHGMGVHVGAVEISIKHKVLA
jgi:hypothetical protein